MLDVFETVNKFYAEEGKAPFFDITLLHMDEVSQTYSEYNLMRPDSEKTYDILLIPAFKHDVVPKAVSLNMRWIQWLQQQYEKGSFGCKFLYGSFSFSFYRFA
jgi:hypothetical protein